MNQLDINRDVLRDALDRNAIGAFLEGCYVLDSGDRLGFWAWIDWPERHIRKAYWDGHEWMAIRLLGYTGEVQAAILRSAQEQWLSISTPTDVGIGLNLADPERHAAEIEMMMGIGCLVVVSRVEDEASTNRLGIANLTPHDEMLYRPGDAVGIPSGVADRLDDERVRGMVIATVAAAKRSGAFTVIEEVSTRQQLRVLRALGVDAAMGPLFDGCGPHFDIEG